MRNKGKFYTNGAGPICLLLILCFSSSENLHSQPYPQPNPNTPGTRPGYPPQYPNTPGMRPGYPSQYPNTPSGYPGVSVQSSTTIIPTDDTAHPGSSAPASTPADLSKYQEPKLDAKPFDPEKIGLSSTQKSEIATQLAQVIRLLASKDPKPPYELATKALGIAFILDPENRTAVISNLQFTKNIRFENIPEEPSAATVALNLFKIAQNLKDQADENPRIFRRYLMDVALQINPSNEDLLYEHEMLRRREGDADWSKILASAKAPAGSSQVKASAKQLSILSLMVSELDSGDFAGRAMNMTATLTPRESTQPTRLMVSGTLGKDMLTSFEETARAVKAKGTVLPSGGDITVSFGQKYSSKDGPSASVALGLLLMALSEQIQIDPQFAVTGDMNVDGSIHAIGAVSAKIRGASLANCSRMAIPEENMRDLEDMATLKDLDTLWKAQIFTVKNLDEASQLAAKEPNPNLAKGIAAFAELQDFCRKNPPGTSFSNPLIRQKLAETLAAAPNHASALVLQKYIDNRLPKTLSLRTSINEIFNAAGPFFDFIYRNERSRSSNSSGYSQNSGSGARNIFAFSQDVYDKATDRLYALSFQIDPLASDLHTEVNNLVRNWRSASQKAYSPTEIKRLVEAAEKVDGSIQKIREDHNIQEILSR